MVEWFLSALSAHCIQQSIQTLATKNINEHTQWCLMEILQATQDQIFADLLSPADLFCVLVFVYFVPTVRDDFVR